ncbi:FMN-binding negative transcriptional regulator [Nocardioides sp. zg-1228]|uniref:FMN-binding negative transcriptional regulator n=1 Tax=Nocardioides sp. zg-1228 TaxID=2763008 RepID=UPI001642EC67|nr:FMN-binding negative transcriptional regulator [Nocardioides sp. zg-1228]MBC2933654.1 FMN-binding negative transcriptional regulator [Nocardioides sp. zg-1228]QSF56226.1 FMN-binding negative transcriptional regulator [Nocardioides sp. zg-1228]
MSSTPATASLYVPRANAMGPDDVRPFVAAVGTAQLVTVGEDGVPDATFLPVLWEGDRLVGHLARANRHWQRIVAGAPALAIVTGPDAYVSPSWYAAKAEHGRVVPTWNYSVVHLRGSVTVHDDAGWVRGLVTRLTDHHEQQRAEPWAVADAPDDYVDKNLRPIVGVEVVVSSVEAKAKLSQNRSAADRAGVAAGLAADGRDPGGLVAP